MFRFKITRDSLVLTFGSDSTLVTSSIIKYRKERLTFLSILPVSLWATLVPYFSSRWSWKLIIRFGVISTIIPGAPKKNWKRFEPGRQDRITSHMMGTNTVLIHASYDSTAARRTNSCSRISVSEAYPFGRQLINVGSNRMLITIATKMRANVLCGNPKYVWFSTYLQHWKQWK